MVLTTASASEATSVSSSQDCLIHEIFERQVERAPQTMAVVCDGRSLTFDMLNRRANQLARHLRAMGVGPDRLVGICLDRSVDMLVAILGIFKSGGAYVPIDPSYPRERIGYILEDANPHVVVTHGRFEHLLARESLKCVTLDLHEREIEEQEDSNINRHAVGLKTHHLAYVIYTSGSTGRPNGVMVEHHNVVNYWPVIERLYRQPVACNHIAINAPFTFDVSVQQYVMLLSGCTLFLIPEVARRDLQMLFRFFEEHHIEGVDCTPSQLNLWVSSNLLEEHSANLRTVIVGGEAMDEPLWVRLAQSKSVAFYNVYGPTETTVFCTTAYLQGAATPPHIGRPVESSHVYILDAQHQPVANGSAGEIFIAGSGVSRGYWNRPQLTSERFITDPFRGEGHARMYKSGDIGRRRADGYIEFLGRNDDQVKIRGFRIELGDIKAQLLRHDQVSDAAVVLREDGTSEKLLVAYVTLRAASRIKLPPTSDEWRAFMADRLPDHMMPSAFVILEELPLTESGKLNRHALPAPTLGVASINSDYSPQGEIEETIAGIWKAVLRLKHIGPQDKFLPLGGNSIQAMRIVTRIVERFGISMSFPDVFQYPTVALMSHMVRGRLTEQVLTSGTQPVVSETQVSGSGLV